MTPAFPSLRDDVFSVETTVHGDEIQTRLVGNADMEAIAPLGELLHSMHTELLRIAARDIVVDLRELEFMNSACLKLFVNWVGEILDAPEEQRYKLRFRSNPEMRWQRRSLIALQCFTTELVVLE